MSSAAGTYSPLDSENPADTTLDYDLDRKPQKLLFGIEFEFAVAQLHPRRADPDPKDPRSPYLLPDENHLENRTRDHIAKTLNDELASIYGSRLRVLRGTDSMKKCRYAATINQVYRSGIGEHQVWNVHGDISVEWDPRLDLIYKIHGIEVGSPAFVYNEASIFEVRKFCEKIRDTYRVNLGRAGSSVHVHVGTSDGDGIFSFKTIQNAMAIVWTFEKQLLELHAEFRHNYSYCTQLSKTNIWITDQARGMKSPESELDGNEFLRCGLNIIEKTKTTAALVDLFSGSGLTGYNIMYVDGDISGSVKKTMEFRHHEGCLDPDEIEHWVAVCVGILRFAGFVKTEKLFTWLEKCLQDDTKPLSVIEVLEALKMPLAAYYWEKKIQERDAESQD